VKKILGPVRVTAQPCEVNKDLFEIVTTTEVYRDENLIGVSEFRRMLPIAKVGELFDACMTDAADKMRRQVQELWSYT